MKKVCVCFSHVITTHISPSSLMFHPSLSAPSLLFPHGRPDWTAVSDILSDASRPKIAGQAHSNKCEDEFGYMAKDSHFTGSLSPSSLTRWPLRMMTRRSSTIQNRTVSLTSQKPTHDNTGWFGVPTVCETSVSPISRGDLDLQKESKESLPDSGNRGQTEDAEGQRRFCDQCWRVDVENRSTTQYEESFSSDSTRIPFQ